MDGRRITSRWLLLVPLLLICAGLALAWFAGQQTARQLDGVRALLIARDDVRVNAFEYEPGLFAGTLHYDLIWEPGANDPLQVFVPLIESGGDELRLKGELPVRHGPWVGGEHGIAVSAASLDAPLPDELRELLPQYPGREPLAVLDIAANWSGTLAAVLRVIDYDGRLLDPDTGQRMQLTLQGARAEAILSDAGRGIDLSIQVPRFLLKSGTDSQAEGMEFAELSYEQALVEEGPGLWLGDAAVRLATARIGGDGTSIELTDIVAESEATSDDQTIDNTGSIRVGRSSFVSPLGTTPIAGAELTVGLRNIDQDAYVDLLAQIEETATDEFDSARLAGTFGRILSAGPRFSIDRLAFGISDDNDFTARMSLGLRAGDPIDVFDVDAIIARLEAQAGARIALSGLRAATRLYLASSGQLNGDERAENDLIEATLSMPLAMIRQSEWVTVTDEAITADIRLADGQLQSDGKPVATAQDLTALADLFADDLFAAEEEAGYEALDEAVDEPAFASAAEQPAATVGPALLPDFSAEPLTQRLQIVGGFEPDPQSHAVVAGGPQQAEALIGGCTGFINSAQPDIVIDYQPDKYVLSLYAEATEDTSLVVHAPDGNWYCNDDYEGRGLNPGVGFESPLAGSYAIWIGSVSGGEAPAVLYISEAPLSQ